MNCLLILLNIISQFLFLLTKPFLYCVEVYTISIDINYILNFKGKVAEEIYCGQFSVQFSSATQYVFFKFKSNTQN